MTHSNGKFRVQYQSTSLACLWIVIGSWNTWMEPTQTQGEHAQVHKEKLKPGDLT